MTSWPELLGALMTGDDLGADQTAWVMARIIAGEATDAQIAAFCVALRIKGETADEVSGLVAAMLEAATPITVPGPTVDVVGTGGDRSGSVNLSTMAALVVAAAGERVVKHGNRSATSQAGSADVLEALGVRLDLSPDQVAEVASTAGVTFCFAPVFHPGMRFAAVPRREVGVPTVFNILGPLANPAAPTAMAVGCAEARLAPVMTEVLARRGVTVAVVRGDDGLDEVSTVGPNTVWRSVGGAVVADRLDTIDLGLPRVTLDDLAGGDVTTNAAIARRVLGGEPGPVRDAVAVNAALALAAAEAAAAGGWSVAEPITDVVARQLPRAVGVLESGGAAAVLDGWLRAVGSYPLPTPAV